MQWLLAAGVSPSRLYNGLDTRAMALLSGCALAGFLHTLFPFLLNQKNGDLQQNFILIDGDVVYIPTNEQMKVHILGEVTKQTTLRMDPGGMNLTEALGEASGVNNNIANAKGVFVIRAEAGMPNNKIGRIYQLDLSDASAHVMGTQFQLQPNDVVYVTAAPVARWNRVMSNVFPSVSNLLSITNTAGQF